MPKKADPRLFTAFAVELRAVELGIQPALRQEFPVCAALDDPPADFPFFRFI